MNPDLIEYLSQFVSERRLTLFDKLLDLRTRFITIVLEDIYQAHNASAVLRSCECFGIQDVHIIENQFQYRISPDVALGSNKWLTLYRYNQPIRNTETAIQTLREKGYRIVATSPHKNNDHLEDFNLEQGKTALLFGSELKGLSPVALNMADEFIKIPMAGFTESLNISVTAALCIHHLTGKMRKNETIPWHLSEEEKKVIKYTWLLNSIKRSDLIEKAFYERILKEQKKEN